MSGYFVIEVQLFLTAKNAEDAKIYFKNFANFAHFAVKKIAYHIE